MSPLPAAEEIREALKELRSEDAKSILAQALKTRPDHADLICEQGMIDLLAQNEAKAASRLEKARGGLRYEQLERALAEHFYCVRQSGQQLDIKQEEIVSSVKIDPTRVGTRLSACLIVKNEERHLARCLSSIRNLVDEIVVVDTGSTDATLAIAEEFGARIGHFPWTNDFSAARNASLQLATGHWILWIDADEELSPESARSIRQALVRPQFGGFNIEIVNYVDDRENGSVFVHSPIRLFRRLPEIEFSGSVHEQVSPAIEALGLPWARLEGARLYHFGYRPSEVVAKGKQERTISMIQDALADDPDNAFQWFNLANAYSIAARFGEAAQAAKECIRLAPDRAPYIELAFQIRALSLSAIGKLDEAVAVCEQAEARGDSGMFVEFELAQILLKMGRHEAALDSIDRCIAARWKEGQTGDRGIETHKRYVVRGQILAALGRHPEALEMFGRALEFDPGYGPGHYCLAAAHEELGQFAEAARSFAMASEDPGIRAAALKGEARAQAALGRHGRAAECSRLAWSCNNEDLESWINWCDHCTAAGDGAGLLAAFEEYAAVSSLSSAMLVNWGRALAQQGHTDRALQLYSEAIQREPENANAYFNCGDLLFQMGQLHDAAHLYENGLRHDRDNAEAWFTLGNSLAKLGITEGAVASYEQTLRISPTHEKARHNLEIVAA